MTDDSTNLLSVIVSPLILLPFACPPPASCSAGHHLPYSSDETFDSVVSFLSSHATEYTTCEWCCGMRRRKLLFGSVEVEGDDKEGGKAEDDKAEDDESGDDKAEEEEEDEAADPCEECSCE